ncbi:MAG TPA: cob(I)yrinic acid a,c-diamide adenosyltransferase [Anaerolineae bacterium]|nr:cob(I)yrinic acid a,c-diamide adenosyltransferase [Anaerolineae bacterium]
MSGRIYTRGGDAGETSLLAGGRVAKDDPRINVYGTLDEATSAMGMARAATTNDDICADIIELQGELINVMAEVAARPGGKPSKIKVPEVEPVQVDRLEQRLDHYLAEQFPQTGFVRPGISMAASALDLARSTVRRAERFLVNLNRAEPVNPVLIKYVNRLSDLLYVMARVDEQRTIEHAVKQGFEKAALTPNPSPSRRGESRQEVNPMSLTLKDCDRMIEAGMKRAAEIGVPMVLAVVNDSGNPVELRRMDDALEVSVTLAPHKAYTAATVRMPTHELAELSQPGQPLFGIDVNMPKLTLIGGGLPLKLNHKLVGAVGVSGGSVEQDIDVAQAMVAAF